MVVHLGGPILVRVGLAKLIINGGPILVLCEGETG